MRRIIASILALAALMGLGAVLSPTALADGDPASDILATPSVSVFNPPDSGATREQVAQMQAAVEAADHAGLPIKVALVGSAADLGSVTQDWGDPRAYAPFLEAELSYVFHGRLLIVMPQGSTLYSAANTAGDAKAMTNVPPGRDLAAIAAQTVVNIAAANGHPIRVGSIRLDSSAAGSNSSIPLIAFVTGLIVLLGAWGISLRVRPLRRRVIA